MTPRERADHYAADLLSGHVEGIAFVDTRWECVRDRIEAAVAAAEREARAKAARECIEIIGGRAQELAVVKHPTERQMGAFDAISALEDEVATYFAECEPPAERGDE